jgi:UDP-N-acetyl-D-glucosamine dehydrogenase
VNIALANEFANAARELEVDVMEIIEAASTKPYGYTPFYPGAGVGGHCIPCDPHYLLWQLRARRISSPLVEAAMNAIATRPREVINQAWRILAERAMSLRGARVLVVGVSYKPGLSDVRESPALAIIEMLVAEGADVSYADPYVAEITVPGVGRLEHHASAEEEQWDLIIAHTMHPGLHYDWLDRQPVVLDTTYRLDSVHERHLL